MEDLKLILTIFCCCKDIIGVGISLDLIFAETCADMIGVSLHRKFNTFILITIIGIIAINLGIIPMTLWILSLQPMQSLHLMICISIVIIGSFNRLIFVINIWMLRL